MKPAIQTLSQLRRFAVTHTLFKPGTLQAAFDRMGFVQADPICAPARAQDLILRHRVRNDRAGDLERAYPGQQQQEGYLYACGFKRPHWPLVHQYRPEPLAKMQQDVLAAVKLQGPLHPKELEAHFGRERRTNPWGGQSRGVGRVGAVHCSLWVARASRIATPSTKKVCPRKSLGGDMSVTTNSAHSSTRSWAGPSIRAVGDPVVVVGGRAQPYRAWLRSRLTASREPSGENANAATPFVGGNRGEQLPLGGVFERQPAIESCQPPPIWRPSQGGGHNWGQHQFYRNGIVRKVRIIAVPT